MTVVVASVLGSCGRAKSLDHSQRLAGCGEVVLALREARARALPDSFRVWRATQSERGDVLLWGHQPTLLVLRSSGAIDGMRLPQATSVIGARWIAGGRIAVLDRWNWAEITLESDGSVLRRNRLPMLRDDRITSAVELEDGWAVGTVSPAGDRYQVYRIQSDREPRRIGSVAIPREHRAKPNFLLGAAGSRVLVVTPTAPLHAWAVAVDGGTGTTFARLDASLLEAYADSGVVPSWRALSMLQLGCNYVLSLADLASNRRVFAVFGPDGRLHRLSHVDAPIGLIAATEHEVLAYRRTIRPELVTYAW